MVRTDGPAPRTISVGHFLSVHRPEVTGFLISFAVIARLWMVHHSIFEHVRAYNQALLTLSLLWGFTIVVLPLPTAIISELHDDRLAVAIYIGNMALSSLLLTAMTIVVARNPELEAEHNPFAAHSTISSVASTSLFLLALLLGSTIASVGLWACLLLILSGPVSAVLERSGRSRRAKAAAAQTAIDDAATSDEAASEPAG
ncbi:MAG: hypothetical protein JWM34_138 [Ilumatobacteraceae bacterium]|nr:hypothetical protein [Ilumatobacteraceae bacterium]